MKLIIVHYHLRPGGIRRIIELATPHLLRQSGGALREVVLAVGEAEDAKWTGQFRDLLAPVPVKFFTEPAFSYFSEQRRPPAALRQHSRAALAKLLAGATHANTVVWAHNLGIARNLILTHELAAACERRGVPLLAHHHDWWFDNRWSRWPEMRRCGVRTLAQAAATVFPAAKHVRHLTINHADARILKPHLHEHVTWLPNLTERTPPPPRTHVRAAADWLQGKLGEHDAPVWMLPCRLLRRKNVAEALLLTRWLRPEAWLVTTGGVSSADEQAYARKLDAAARRHHWRLRLGVLAGDEARKPAVAELVAASECVLLTSIQEGFGLPYLEAAASRRPLIARAIPNIAPDLAQFGFRFPQCYEEVLVPPDLFDARAEQQRQARWFTLWKQRLPHACRRLVGKPIGLRADGDSTPVPFSRLTLTAQLEVLAHPVHESWARCAPLNPFLGGWQKRARVGRLQITPWPRTADGWLSGPAYARRWAETLARPPRPAPSQPAAVATQREFIAWKLGAEHLFPLLWSPET